MSNSPDRMVLVSNRGPATFERDGQGQIIVRRGGGGLVAVLKGLLVHHDALWIASAMTEEDAEVTREHDNKSFAVDVGDISYKIRLVESDPDAYDRFYNVIANPMLWFIQHYLWDLSNAPDFRLEEREAWDLGYKRVNEDLGLAVVDEIEGAKAPVVMMHDYHLYTCPGVVRAQRNDAFIHLFIHIPWPQPDAWRVLPNYVRRELFEGLLACDIIGFQTESSCRNFLHCCRELLGLDTDYRKGAVFIDGRECWARAYPIAVDSESMIAAAGRPEVLQKEKEIVKRRRKHLIVRVDRTDLSKNILRGLTSFDIFLEQNPEFHEDVTFIAHLQPSRQDVPEYIEYLERIDALVAVVNHRHGTTDWMPIDLRISENLDAAIAAYKQYDLLMVNSIFDGMNLVSKEGPLVNTRNGVVMLSENTGSHHELGDCALTVNPFDVQQQADAILEALTMSEEQKLKRETRLKEILQARGPSEWVNDQLADIELKRLSQSR